MSYSRFYRSDLQIHTPADRQQEYGNVGGREPNPEFANSLMEAHAVAGVEIVAVTDHNRVDWYPLLSEAGEKHGVSVFPGVEINVNGCHLIVLWDRTGEDYELSRQFLQSLWAPGQSPFTANGDPKPVASGQVLEIAKRASDHRALVLAPHATAKNSGLLARGVCSNRNEIAQSGRVLGFDVYGDKMADVLGNPRSVFGDAPPAWFISGDVRSLDQIGHRTTYLKLADEPSLEGIRQAFLMPDTRIRFPNELQSDWHHASGVQFIESPQPEWPRLQNVEIEGGFHSGLKAKLAPGLNAIIGGKGTGKSTLIEILRYVVDEGEPLVKDGGENRRANFRANAEARISITNSSGEEYVIHRSGDDSPARLLRDGSDTEVSVGRRFEITVFGQRELQELAKREDRLRDFVASQAGPEWDKAVREETEPIDKLLSGDTELNGLEGDIKRAQEYSEELTDIEERLLRAQEKGAEGLIEESKTLAELDRNASEVLGWPTKVKEAVDALGKALPAPVPMVHRLAPTALQGYLVGLEAEVTRTVDGLRNAVDIIEQKADAASAEWKNNKQQERHRIQSELAEAGIADPGELENLQGQKAEIADNISNLEGSAKRKEELLAGRKRQLQVLANVRRRKSRLTESAAKELSSRVGDRIRVRTDPMANRTALLGLFNEHLRGQNVRRSTLEELVKLSPSTVAEAMLDGITALEKLGCPTSAAAKLAELPSSFARSYEECETPDEVIVEINLGAAGSESWARIQTVSPGQRATALLAVALVSGTSPLIIDQPEDDLDNRYIYDEVVKVLRQVCKQRQVIVATHNANVVVLGDAELVLALDANAGQAEVLAFGGLESPGVADATRTILEGGDEAFRARHRRYLMPQVSL